MKRSSQPTMEDVLSSLRNSSFAALDAEDGIQRVVMNLMGKDKEGKTHMGLAFSELGPLALFDFDFGTEGVSKKFRHSGAPIVHAKYLIRDDSDEGAMERWKRFRRDWYAALKSPKIRSMMLDQGASMYQAIRLALFGRLSKVPPHKYDAVNAELNKIITSVYPTDKNLILLHPLKAEYKRDGDDDMGRKTGKLVMDGWPRIPYLVQVNAVAYRSHSKEQKQADPEGYKDEPPAGGFGLKIINCRHNPKAAGVKLFGSKRTPQELLKVVFAEEGDGE